LINALFAGTKIGNMVPKTDTKTSGDSSRASLQFSAINGILGAAGILTVALGFFLLSQGSITAAPLLLVLGYLILLPLAIIL
jgi:hypothetical protein